MRYFRNLLAETLRPTRARAGGTRGARNVRRRDRYRATDRLSELLRSRRLRDWRFRRQHPLGPFVVDFVCIEQALVVEIERSPAIDSDEARRVFLERLGYRVLRFPAGDVLRDPGAVRRAITARLR
jgi:very-short-patch-repair endonuclease